MEYRAEKSDIIWKKGDGEMPPEAKHVVNAAKNEILLRALNLPPDVANEIKYRADKNSQTIGDYITGILTHAVTV